jgi:hypothetical protein
MHACMWGKEGYIAIKLDMSKAYDMVEWGFLKAVMKRLGFARRWIRLMLMCVQMNNYAAMINGIPMGNFQATKGLLQGIPFPLICFLFVQRLSILCVLQLIRRGY